MEQGMKRTENLLDGDCSKGVASILGLDHLSIFLSTRDDLCESLLDGLHTTQSVRLAESFVHFIILSPRYPQLPLCTIYIQPRIVSGVNSAQLCIGPIRPKDHFLPQQLDCHAERFPKFLRTAVIQHTNMARQER